MSVPIRALIAIEEGLSASLVQPSLPVPDDLEVIAIVEGLESREKAAAEPSADILIVACFDHSEGALGLIQEAAAQRPERPVVVLQVGGEAHGNGFLSRVFAAGADDLVALPETEERVWYTLQKAIARRRRAALGTPPDLAPLVCVVGPKGGTGKTVTACNLAVSLAERGRRITLVDLDLRFGDVGLALRLPPERTLYDLARAGGTLDAGKLDGFLAVHPSGARVLLAPTRPDHAGAVGVDFLAEIFPLLRAASDFVLVDTTAGFPPEVIAAIDASTDVCMVGMLDALSLKNTKLGLETLELMGYGAERIRIVLNRADSHVGIGHDDVKVILGRAPDVLVPSDREIPRSLSAGVPIVLSHRRSGAARAFRSLAALYLGEDEPAHEDVRPQRLVPALLRR